MDRLLAIGGGTMVVFGAALLAASAWAVSFRAEIPILDRYQVLSGPRGLMIAVIFLVLGAVMFAYRLAH